MKTKFFVVCFSHEEYREYIHRKMANPNNQYMYYFVRNVHDLRGISANDLQGCYYGNWRARPDINEIKTMIHVIKGHWNSAGIV
jgi:hypothetical protein